MNYFLIYLGIGVLILWRDARMLSGEKDPPPHLRSDVEAMRGLIEMRSQLAGPIFFFTTVLLWGPLILYAIFAWLMGLEEE